MRLLVYPRPRSLYEAARFIASALLLSHSIRLDAVAAVRVSGSWVVARGSRVRHLRPDADTAEGWLRAVLKGRAERLGAEVSSEPPDPAGPILLVERRPSGRGLHRLPGEPVTLCFDSCPYDAGEAVEAPDLPVNVVVEAANIIVDRRSVGLGACWPR